MSNFFDDLRMAQCKSSQDAARSYRVGQIVALASDPRTPMTVDGFAGLAPPNAPPEQIQVGIVCVWHGENGQPFKDIYDPLALIPWSRQ